MLVFSHKLIVTMQSVVTGHAPITLEHKITSGGKQMKKEDNTHNNCNKRYTSDKKKNVRRAYVRINIHIYTWYRYISFENAKRLAAETETEETA